MSVVRRILVQDFSHKLQIIRKLNTLRKERPSYVKSGTSRIPSYESSKKDYDDQRNKPREKENSSNLYPANYRFAYREFLPDPNPMFRNSLREKLERIDMITRRSSLDIPEFYVGSILAVTHSDIHAPGKSNRFVGICIQRSGCGLRASFILRNIVDGQGVEINYDLYDPCIQKIECLRLEKRLDDTLIYLRDAPPKYSTVPLDLEPELVTDRKHVPVNRIKVPLRPQPWDDKYELFNYKGIQEDTIVINKNRTRKALKAAKPWAKYDLMKIYRKTIPEEDQQEIFSELHSKLHELEINQQKQKRARVFVRPKKTA